MLSYIIHNQPWTEKTNWRQNPNSPSDRFWVMALGSSLQQHEEFNSRSQQNFWISIPTSKQKVAILWNFWISIQALNLLCCKNAIVILWCACVPLFHPFSTPFLAKSTQMGTFVSTINWVRSKKLNRLILISYVHFTYWWRSGVLVPYVQASASSAS